MFTDTHCHISEEEFFEDRDQALTRAHDAGIKRMITVGGSPEMNQRVVELSESRDDVFSTVGLDPFGVKGKSPRDTAELKGPLKASRVVALGEIGLDQHHRYTSLDHQRDMFRAQLALAAEVKLPVVIHSRLAPEATLEDYGASARPGGVWHSFTGSREDLFRALDLGLFISLSGIVTFGNAEDLRTVAPLIPRDRLVLETDAPYLAPVPHRGKRNEPAFLIDTARLVASLRKVSLDELSQTCEANTATLFTKIGNFSNII